MFRSGNFCGNALQKHSFGHMKAEIDLKSCMTFFELELAIDNYMDYYNNYRYLKG